MVGGHKLPFPTAGKSLEDATRISPGLYIAKEGLREKERLYFKLYLRSHQTLAVDFRTPESGCCASAYIYDGNGANVAGKGVVSPSALESIAWSPSIDESVYFTIGSSYGVVPDSLYCISIR